MLRKWHRSSFNDNGIEERKKSHASIPSYAMVVATYVGWIDRLIPNRNFQWNFPSSNAIWSRLSIMKHLKSKLFCTTKKRTTFVVIRFKCTVDEARENFQFFELRYSYHENPLSVFVFELHNGINTKAMHGWEKKIEAEISAKTYSQEGCLVSYIARFSCNDKPCFC